MVNRAVEVDIVVYNGRLNAPLLPSLLRPQCLTPATVSIPSLETTLTGNNSYLRVVLAGQVSTSSVVTLPLFDLLTARGVQQDLLELVVGHFTLVATRP